MTFANCPKCDKQMNEIKVSPIPGRLGTGDAYKCVVFTCPHCHSVLSSGVDWLALGTEIADKVAKRLGR